MATGVVQDTQVLVRFLEIASQARVLLQDLHQLTNWTPTVVSMMNAVTEIVAIICVGGV